MSFKSSSPNLDCRNRGGTKPKKKVKKLRSMKLSEVPSLNPSARQVKSQFEHAPVDSFNDDASSEPSQIELSSTSPSYMKNTSWSDAKKESSKPSFHNSESSFDRNNPIENESNSWKPNIVSFGQIKAVGNSRRVLSLKSSRPLKKRSSRIAPFPNFADYVMPHQEGNESDGASVSSSSSVSSSEDSGMRGGTEHRKTLKKSRSTRFKSFRTSRPTSRRAKSRFDQPLSSLSSDAANPPIQVADASPNYLKATSCSEGKKMHFQASLHGFSESSCGSIDESRRNSHNSKSNSGGSNLKSMKTLRRTSSLRTLRILVNKSSFKSKRPSVKKCSQVSQDSSVNRATCSSTLKASKFLYHVELHPGERELERISVMKVCTYNHCSLHGHHHSPTPPLKCLLYKRRHLLKTQKSIKLRSQSSLRAKYPDDIMKEIETGHMVGSDFSVQIYNKPSMETFRRSSQGNEDANLAEVLFGETSYPDKGVQENLNQERNFVVAEQDILEPLSKHKETKLECCCIQTSSSLLSLKPDNSVTICYDEIPSSNLGFRELEEADLTGISGEPSNIVKISTPDDIRDATEDNHVISSASISHSLEELSVTRDEKNGAIATDQETIQQSAPDGDSEPNSTPCKENKSQLHKKKHISMWHLIHQHMVSDLVAEAGTQLLEEAYEEKLVDDTNTLPAPESSGCSPGFSDSYQNMGIEHSDTDNQEIELHKMYAIKMVREAIEKILLPEVQDQSSDDQSISSDISSEQELLEKNHGEGGQLSISNFTADKISGPAKEVTASKEGETAEKKTLKGWSNLKKLILLKRFIKELEKVRKFNPRKPQHLPLEPHQEAEKVFLRHQMIDKKKSSEEWMLDYALQQVVSELAPTQRRKVTLLIKAFETVVPPSDEQKIEVKFPNFKGIRDEECSTESELDKYVCQATYKDTKVEANVTSNLDNGDNNSIITDKRSNVLVDGKAEQEAHEHRMSNLKMELLREDSASTGQTMEVDGFNGVTDRPLYIIESQTGATDGPASITKRPTSDDFAEAAVDNTVISSSCVCGPLEELTAAREQKYGDSELDTESNEGFCPVRNFEPDNSGHKAYKTEFGKEKHVSMWHLIHEHMVAGLAVEGKTKQLEKENEENLGDANTLAAIESSGSCPGFSASFHNIGMEYHDTDSQEVELRKIYAIKLVREAIEKILLPEVQDQSSDDQSVTSESMSDQELIEKKSGEVGEPSISNSTDYAKDSTMECDSNKVKDDISLSQEGTRLSIANILESEDEKPASKVQQKSDKRTPKGWSNLKKLILLKRFIKELEKVRKFNPQKPRHLPIQPGPEAKEVCSRHQRMDERKSAEEWMLDYAIRKVVSELAPKQKTKVALLVQAFETVVPPSEEPQIQVTFPKFKGTNGDNNSIIIDKISDVAVDEEAPKEVHKDIVSSFSLKLLKDGYDTKLDGFSSVNVEPSYVSKSAAPDGSSESTEIYTITSLASDCESMEQLTAANEKNNGDSESIDKAAYKTQLDNQKYIRMWHLLCQHVVSGIATKVETQILDGEDENEQVDDAKTLPQVRTSSFYDYSRADHDKGNEDNDSSSQKIGFNKRDAVKLVQEAIEEILLPDIQDDSSDTQSMASDTITEQELLEKNHGNVGEPSILTSIDSPKDSFREYEINEVEGHNIIPQEERGSANHNTTAPDEQKAVSMVGNKVDQQKPKNWNELKKLILMKRSIKALEKARKSNLRTPRNLPLEPGPEEEKVYLRHQLNDERKKAKEWMLDYALQHIVTKLTPARKRRVAMLVEAFEAVVPLPKI